MKSPVNWFALLVGSLTLFSAGCASRDYEARSAPGNQFYCHNCDEYHSFQHAHYRYYSDAGERAYPPRPSQISVVTQPGRSTPLGVPQPFMRPPHSTVD